MRKICVITGTRAEYGVMKPFLERIRDSADLRLQLVVCGMHLMRRFGSSVDIIRKDGFKISAKLDIFSGKEGGLQLAGSFARAVPGFARIFKKLEPDIVVLEADRIEMLAAGLAAAFLNLPIVHISGGDVSGGMDDAIRHSLSRFAHLHLANTKASCKRLLRMGEEPWRIKYVGTLAVSKAILGQSCSKEEIRRKLGIDLNKALFLVIQHPVANEYRDAALQMRRTLEAARHFKTQTVIFYPNCDMGGQSMIKEILKYRKFPFIRIFKNIERPYYLGLLKYASVLIGNSSSGIVEAPFFGTPVVNIGSRQDGRERAANVVDVPYSKRKIIQAIKRFRKNSYKRIKGGNPYRDLNTDKKITNILRAVKLDDRLLNRRLSF